MKIKKLFTILLVSSICSIVVPCVLFFSIHMFESKKQKDDDYNKVVNSIVFKTTDDKITMDIQKSLQEMTRFSDSIKTVILIQELKLKYPNYKFNIKP